MRETYERVRTWRVFVDRPLDWLVLLRIYYGNLIWLLPLAAFAPFLWRSRRTRFAAMLVLVIGAASMIEVWWYPHYGAPFTVALLVILVQSMRYLRQWNYGGRELGRFLVNATMIAFLTVTVASAAKAIVTHRTADQVQAKQAQKNSAETELLEKHPGRHVVFVRYTRGSNLHRAWIYNPADIDAAPVIWARDLSRTENERLRQYYTGRSFWLFQPDESLTATPY